jgi:hypothetical protein
MERATSVLMIQGIVRKSNGCVNISREIRKFLQLVDFNYFIVRGRAAHGPFDRFFSRIHLYHPETAESLLCISKGAVGYYWLTPGECDTGRGWRPSSDNSTRASCSDLLYFIIASTALASGIAPGAVSYPFGIISIMNRIEVPPSC